MAKRTKKDHAPHVSPDKVQRCEMEGCDQPGEYKAPRSRTDLRDYRYLCLDHVREHNKQWDYFKGMNADEIEHFMKDAVTGHRPTWERGTTIPNASEKLYAAVNDLMKGGTRRKTKEHPHLAPRIKKAMALFELDHPFTMPKLKNRYKELVKRYHPDHNQGDKLAEEKFKAVASAYKVLEAHLSE